MSWRGGGRQRQRQCSPSYHPHGFDLQLRQCIQSRHRIMILMRGLPGSGKSTLARDLAGEAGQVCSSDDYFVDTVTGEYKYDQERIQDAHSHNLKRVTMAMESNVTPVIVDNTNIRKWEMDKYVAVARKRGYEIHFAEPGTEWKRNVKECSRRNAHGVPKAKIQQMAESFDRIVSLDMFPEKSASPGPPRPLRSSPPPESSVHDSDWRPAFADPIQSQSPDICPPSDPPKVQRVRPTRMSTPIAAEGGSDQNEWAPLPNFLPASPPGPKSESSSESPLGFSLRHNGARTTNLVGRGIQTTGLPSLPTPDDSVEEVESLPQRKPGTGEMRVTETQTEVADVESAAARLAASFPEVSSSEALGLLEGVGGVVEVATKILSEAGYRLCPNPAPATLTVPSVPSPESSPNASRERCEQRRKARPPRQPAEIPITFTHSARRRRSPKGPKPPSPPVEEEMMVDFDLEPGFAEQLRQLHDADAADDLPAQLLEPAQLRITLPLRLSQELYNYWVSTRAEASEEEPRRPTSLAKEFPSLYDTMPEQLQEQLDCEYARRLFEAEQRGVADPATDAEVTKTAQLANLLKLDRLKESFPSVDVDYLEATLRDAHFGLSDTIATVEETTGQKSKLTTGIVKAEEARLAASSSGSSSSMSSSEAAEAGAFSYEMLRREAELHHDKAAQARRKGAEAHRNRNFGAILHYQEEARKATQRAREANERAAKAILALREAEKGPQTLDLHGLHVSEALAALKTRVAALRPAYRQPGQQGKVLEVITGVGHHSREGQSRLRPNVIAALRQWNLRFEEVAGNKGALRVYCL